VLLMFWHPNAAKSTNRDGSERNDTCDCNGIRSL
jgi:hypothetical protein